jgi:hypothetical protein
MAIDTDKLQDFLGRFVTDLGATFAAGNQAGEGAIRQITADAGFTLIRRAAETPFNLVYEVRP